MPLEYDYTENDARQAIAEYLRCEAEWRDDKATEASYAAYAIESLATWIEKLPDDDPRMMEIATLFGEQGRRPEHGFGPRRKDDPVNKLTAWYGFDSVCPNRKLNEERYLDRLVAAIRGDA